MDRLTLLPSVNWNVSHMLMINEAGTVCAYGSRGDIVVIENVHQDDFNKLNFKFIPRAHKNQRVLGLVFLKHRMNGQITELLASCGDDGSVKIWDYKHGSTTHKFTMKKTIPSVKFIDIDYFPQTENIVAASEQKTIIRWNLLKNKVNVYHLDAKVIMTCIVACPHEEDLVALGARSGLVLIYNMKGEGKLRHKIRCHDNDVYSVSWCPVAYNALQLMNLQKDDTFNEIKWKEEDKTYLLASCSKDRSIYICKAGTNGYCETVLTLPQKPSIANSNNSRYHYQHSNFERGRYLKWIYPLSLLTFTDFNEIVILHMTPKPERRSINTQVASNVKLDIKPLHNIHQRSISNFGVHLKSADELNFRVWSCSVDRLLVRSGYKGHCKEKPMVLPLMSGFIFSLDISPTTYDRLAIGTGDGKICLWDLSSRNSVDIATLSKKIDNKVMSLKWHPYEEGILAFGTYEGRVGMFDVSMGSKTTSWLFKMYHHKPIYKLCWAPPICLVAGNNDVKNKFRSDLCLFAVGNGDILQFNPNDVNEIPVSLSSEVLACIETPSNCKFKTDMCYERDRKVMAIGLSNGHVCILSSSSFALQHIIKEQPKSIMSLAWHPRVVLDSPKETSPYSSWLASAGENVFVHEIDSEGESAPKKVASLELHSSRVLDVSWSPHTNGRLLSCSADSTVIVWDVVSQTVVGRYTEHCAQVLCGVWSLTNKDIIVTGSSDFTCRMWSVSRDTVTSVKEVKQRAEKVIEPTIVNAWPGPIERGDALSAATTVKTAKVETFLPSIGHDVHACPMLEDVIKKTIEHKIDPNEVTNLSVSNASCLSVMGESFVSTNESFTCVEESFGNNELTSEVGNIFHDTQYLKERTSVEIGHGDAGSIEELHADCQVKLKNRKNRNSIDLTCNYAHLFASKEQFLNLITHEERVLENAGSNNVYVLFQARHDLKSKIVEAIEKNQVTEHMLALATSVSPKLWKDACQVYVEQLIRADQIMQAVSFQLAMGHDEEAIVLLCDKNRFKEAFAVARLRFEDDALAKKVLEKWIHFCFTCGLYRLGAHCYLFLNEEEKAGSLLSKSKIFDDIILAAKLLKFHQPERAAELAVDGFKRHLPHLRLEDLQDLLNSFPEIRFAKPWYLSLKYLTNERPNTAAVTKWLIGLSNDDNAVVAFKSEKDMDFVKLQKVVVDNTFDMNYEELTVYVSAQVALYVSGMSNTDFKYAALRHYVRGLLYCYNYKTINSSKIQSDSAYPMMRLLSLLFPSGVSTNFDKQDQIDSASAPLQQSINAYFCDFAMTWLIGCDDLPKSLKLLEQSSSAQETQSPDLDTYNDIRVSDLGNENVQKNATRENGVGTKELQADHIASFVIIKDRKVKLRKMHELMTSFIDDVFDVEAVRYLQNVVKVKQFDSGLRAGEIEVKLKLGLGDGSQIISNVQCESSKLLSTDGSVSGASSTDVKKLRAAVEKFEKERVSSPNPYIFFCKVREYLNANKEEDVELVTKLESLLTEAAKKCGILKN